MDFILNRGGIEQRSNEELSEEVQGMLQGVRVHTEVVVGLLRRCEGIIPSPMSGQVVGVDVLIGVLLCSQNEHVLTEVCQSFCFRRVTE